MRIKLRLDHIIDHLRLLLLRDFDSRAKVGEEIFKAVVLRSVSVLRWQPPTSRTNMGSIHNLLLFSISICLMNDTGQRIRLQICKFGCHIWSIAHFIGARVRVFPGEYDSLKETGCITLRFRASGRNSGLLLGLNRAHVRTGFAVGRLLGCVNLNGRAISAQRDKG